MAELRAEIHAARDLLKDQTAINTSLTEKNEELVAARAEDLKEIANLEKKIDTLSQDISDLKQTLIDNKSVRKGVSAKEVYADVLARADKVEWFNDSSLSACPLASIYKVGEKPLLSVEVFYASFSEDLVFIGFMWVKWAQA